MLLKILGTPKLGAYVTGENGVPLVGGVSLIYKRILEPSW